jgi:predicted metal-dependent HD superfamily phosphohydrolase
VPAERAGLDRERWTRLWDGLGASGDGLAIFSQLVQAYAEPARVYHTADHIGDCLAQLDSHQGLTQRLDEVEAAVWFHDVVYVPSATDNEEQSARLAQSTLSASAIGPDAVHRIAAMILATRHLTLPDTPDSQLVCDIDLSIFGRDQATFEDYERRIRQEYAWVPEPVYRSTRSEILAGFLRRRTIYQTPAFREHYESTARRNLRHLIARLTAAP